ncbi:MAG: thioredoxin-disulfide reductase [Clostridiaceae bacterium]|nr:thioredoxin-disulfide reductase [Clostridiaceae bacterium]
MYDVIIVGGGPAGFTAALYAARAKLKTLIVERAFFGGQMAITNQMENYPGFEEVSGSQLAEKMYGQATKFGAEVEQTEVIELDLDGDIKRIVTKEKTYEAKSVILAMGASPRKLGLANEDNFVGSGISYCATCDGAFFRDKDVAVVGGGDTAAEDAMYLARFCRKVYLIHRRDEMRATKVLADLVLNSPKVVPVWNSVVEEIIGQFGVEAVKVKNNKTGEVSQLDINGLFIAIGYIPNNELVKGKIELNEWGYIKTDEQMRTNIPGVFAAGDVREKTLRQVVTAASDGAAAAHSAEQYLTEKKL